MFEEPVEIIDFSCNSATLLLIMCNLIISFRLIHVY